MQGESRENPSLMVIDGSVGAVQSSHARPSATAEHDDGLSERQRTFVDFYCSGVPKEIAGTDEDIPPGNAGEAAKASGYAVSGAANMASRNLLNPKVQAEVERRVKAGRGSGLLAGTSALLKIVEKGTDERAVVAAAVALLDRFGMAPPKGPSVAVQVNNTMVNAGEASAVLNLIAERASKRTALTGE